MKNGAARGVLVVMVLVGSCISLPGIAHADPTEDAARTLVAFVPKDERYQCVVADATKALPRVGPEAASITAMLSCGPDRVAQAVYYFQFTNAAAMNRAYAALTNGIASEPVRSTDGKCPGEQTWGYHNGNDGRVACDYSTTDINNQAISETVFRAWTDNRANILSFASPKIANVDAVAFRSWWNQNAGPLETADSVKGLASPSSQSNSSAERTLLSHAPKSMRQSCAVIARQPSNPNFFGDRLWVNAGVTCTPTQPGANTVSYLAVDPAAIDGYFGVYKPTADLLNGDCPSVGTYGPVQGKHRRTLGEYSCFFTTDANGARIASYAWSDRARGIVAVAQNNAGDAAALVKWWKGSEAGPV